MKELNEIVPGKESFFPNIKRETFLTKGQVEIKKCK